MSREPLPVFYSPAYWSGAPDFDTFRKSQWIAERGVTGPAAVQLTAPSDVHDAELDSVHTASYLSAVKNGEPGALARSNGFEWTPGIYPAAECSSQGAAQAAVSALKTGRTTGSLSAGLHHARADRGAGFCTFNGLALAARAAIKSGARSVLILDLDAHFGGGTWSIVSAWEDVWQLDVSVDDFDRYDAEGHPRALVTKVESAAEYLDAIEGALAWSVDRGRGPLPNRGDPVRGNAPAFDIVIYNAGMDPCEACIVGGLRGVTTQMLEARERLVFEWARAQRMPIAFVLAGGYTGAALPRDELVDLHMLTIEVAVGGRDSARSTGAPYPSSS